jgi:predicted DNA-binding protein
MNMSEIVKDRRKRERKDYNIVVRVPTEYYLRLLEISTKKGETVSEIVRRLLKQEIESESE